MKYLTFLILGYIILTACGDKAATEMQATQTATVENTDEDVITVSAAQFELGKMEIGTITDFPFSTSVRATGLLEVPLKYHAGVSAYAGGYVSNMNLIPGEHVRKGQLLFRLENPEFVQMQQEYLEAKEQLSYLKSDYERQKTLANENIASQKKFLKAESDYRVTLAKTKGLKKRLSLLNISTDKVSPENLISKISVYAPISGYITELHATNGMFLNPHDVAITMVNTDHMHLELNVFEKDIMHVQKEQKILFRIPETGTQTYEGEVHLIGKAVDDEKRIIRIHGHIKDEKTLTRFVPGMYVEAEIISSIVQNKGLPESAVVSLDEKNYVLISKGSEGGSHRFEQIEVNTGQLENGMIQILNPEVLGANPQILIKGAFNLILPE